MLHHHEGCEREHHHGHEHGCEHRHGRGAGGGRRQRFLATANYAW